LVTQLAREDKIWCHDEVFHANEVFVRWPGWPRVTAPEAVERELRDLRAEDPEAFLNRIFALDFDRAHVGFKIFEWQHPSMLTRILEDPQILKIVLFRANVLAVHASELVASAAGVWGVIDQERRAAIPPVLFDPESFCRFHNRYVAFYARVLERIHSTGQKCQFIRYDELNNSYILANLVSSLGVISAPGKSPAPEPVRGQAHILSRYSNSEEVLEFLRAHSRLEWASEGDVDFEPLGVATTL
jgi:hypothetical protein